MSSDEEARLKIGGAALEALKSKPKNLGQILANLKSLDKAVSGLPNLVEACDATLAGFDEAEAEYGAGTGGAQIGQHRIYTKSIRALASTQIGFAKILQHSLNLLLVSVAGEQHLIDCACVARNCGMELPAATPTTVTPEKFDDAPDVPGTGEFKFS